MPGAQKIGEARSGMGQNAKHDAKLGRQADGSHPIFSRYTRRVGGKSGRSDGLSDGLDGLVGLGGIPDMVGCALFRQRAGQRLGQFEPFVGGQERPDFQPFAVARQHQLAFMGDRPVDIDAQPLGLEPPALHLAGRADPFDEQRIFGQPDGLVHPRPAVIGLEREIDQCHVEPEKPEHRRRN